LEVVLRVHDVPERGVVEHGEGRVGIPHRSGEEGPHVLQRDRVALLGHYGADLHVGVGHPDGPVLLRGPEEQVVHEAPQPEERELEGGRRFAEVVGAAYGVVGVFDETVESEKLRHATPVYSESRGGQGGRTQGAPVAVLECRTEAPEIPREGVVDREEVMGERRRLCLLGMRVGGHHGPHVLGCHREKDALEI
jgi:hypothetical protein